MGWHVFHYKHLIGDIDRWNLLASNMLHLCWSEGLQTHLEGTEMTVKSVKSWWNVVSIVLCDVQNSVGMMYGLCARVYVPDVEWNSIVSYPPSCEVIHFLSNCSSYSIDIYLSVVDASPSNIIIYGHYIPSAGQWSYSVQLNTNMWDHSPGLYYVS